MKRAFVRATVAAVWLFAFFVPISKAQFQYEAAPMQCFQFDTIDLVGTFSTVDIANDGIAPGDLSLATSLKMEAPVSTNDYEISELSVQAVCTFLQDDANGNPRAPMCLIEADMTFCTKRAVRRGRTYVRTGTCPNNSFSGSFMATGTGPRAYAITGGVGTFLSASGSFDPDFPSASAMPGQPVVLPTDITLCFHTF